MCLVIFFLEQAGITDLAGTVRKHHHASKWVVDLHNLCRLVEQNIRVCVFLFMISVCVCSCLGDQCVCLVILSSFYFCTYIYLYVYIFIHTKLWRD